MDWENIWHNSVYGVMMVIIFGMIYHLAQLFGIEHLWSGIPIIND